MPSYTSYLRQMAVLDADDTEIESWITVRGNHIPIKKGQSKEDAVKSFIEGKGGKYKKESYGKHYVKTGEKGDEKYVDPRTDTLHREKSKVGFFGSGKEAKEYAEKLNHTDPYAGTPFAVKNYTRTKFPYNVESEENEEKKGGSGEKKPASKEKKENKSSALVVAERAARYWGKQEPKGMVGIYGREMRETAKELRGLEGGKIYNEKHEVALARAKRQAEYWEKEAENQKGRGMTGIMARERRELYNEIKENVPSAHKIDPYKVKQGDFISFTPEGRKYEVLGYTSGGLTGLLDVKSRKRIDRKIRLTETVYKHAKGVEKMVDTENLGKKGEKKDKK